MNRLRWLLLVIWLLLISVTQLNMINTAQLTNKTLSGVVDDVKTLQIYNLQK